MTNYEHHKEPSLVRELWRDPRVRQSAADAAIILGGAYLLGKGPKLATRGQRRRAGEKIIRTFRPKLWKNMQNERMHRRFWLQVQRGMGGKEIHGWALRKSLRKQNIIQSGKAARMEAERQKAENVQKLMKSKRRSWRPGKGYDK